MKIKSSRNGEITPLFTDIEKTFPICEFLASQICLLRLVAQIKFSRKISDYSIQGLHRHEKYLNLEGFLEESLKIKCALKSTGKSLKGLEKFLNSISCRT